MRTSNHGTIGLALASILMSCTSDTDSARLDMPGVCLYGNPFVSAPCGAALRKLCNSLANERDCSAQEPFSFNDDNNVFACGWAKVVTFSDSLSCTVGSVEGRCELGFITGAACGGDPCGGQPPTLYRSHYAVVSEAELVEMPCIGGSALVGPAGEWLATMELGENQHVYNCGADIPTPPSICVCAQAACEAGEGP